MRYLRTIVLLFIIALFLGGHPVFAANPCTSLTITPNPSGQSFPTNQLFTLQGSGCPANTDLSIVGGLQGQNSTFGFTVRSSSTGTINQKLQNFAQLPGTYELTLFNSLNFDESPPFVITFSQSVPVACGDIVPPNAGTCPNSCRSLQSTTDPSVWLCGGTPQVTEAPQQCTLDAKVTIANGQFQLGVSINQSALRPGNYRLVLNNNAGPLTPKTPFTVTAGQQFQQLGFNNLNSGYTGNTYTLFVETNCINPAAGGCPAIAGCSTQVTFNPNAPTLAPGENPLPSVKPNPSPSPGTPYQIKTCTPTGGEANSGIPTAIGCISGSVNSLFVTLFQLLLGVAGGITFVLIIIGGLTILFSQGNPEKLGAGQEIITSAIVGLLLIIFSVFILRVVGVDVLGIPGFG